MLGWDQRKLDNYSQKQSKQLHQLFLLMNWMLLEVETVIIIL